MKKITSCHCSEHHYKASACIVWCFDDRFTKSLEKIIRCYKIKNYDLVKVAGGAKSLAIPGNSSDKDFILKQIQTSIKLHNAQKIILMTHSDCGAYGGLKAFGNDPDKETEFHKKELENAKKFLEENISQNLKIETIFVDFKSIFRA